jgi:FkbM family methyltransferase
MIRILKQKLKRAYYRLRGLGADVKIPVETLNPGDQAWYFAAGSLKPADIVYSLGLATNIEFDLNLIAKYGVEVHGFDPTPESVEWIRSQALPAQFHHHPVAIAGHDGELEFALPDQAGDCARAVVKKSNVRGQRSEVRGQISDPTSDFRPSTRSVDFPCRKLSSLMQEHGHERIALLKMDIEGSEYEVLEELLDSKLKVDQILVEFHHRFSDIGISRTIGAKKRLQDAGYRQFHLSPWCEEFSFLMIQ